MTLYAVYGEHTRDILTLGGRPLVHDNRRQLEDLLPNCRIVAVSPADLRQRSPLPPLPFREHPYLAHRGWPDRVRKE